MNFDNWQMTFSCETHTRGMKNGTLFTLAVLKSVANHGKLTISRGRPPRAGVN